jgi:hypothetical protein
MGRPSFVAEGKWRVEQCYPTQAKQRLEWGTPAPSFCRRGIVAGWAIPLKPNSGLTRISWTWQLETAACAAFFEESRMKFISANKLHRKSGAWGTQLKKE